jgi:hypothetical protein
LPDAGTVFAAMRSEAVKAAVATPPPPGDVPPPGPAAGEPTPDATATPAAEGDAIRRLTRVEKALMLMARDPNKSLRRVAREVPCHVSLLSRDPRVRRMRQAQAGHLPKGRKGKAGDVEAAGGD